MGSTKDRADRDDEISRSMSSYDPAYDSSKKQEEYEDLEATEGMTNDEIGDYYKNKKK